MEESNHSTEPPFPNCAAMEALLNANALAMGFIQTGKLMWTNRIMAEMFGYAKRDEFLGTSWEDLYADAQDYYRARETMHHTWADAHKGERESLFRRKDGSSFGSAHKLISVNRSDGQGRDAWIVINPWCATMRDQGLRESEERYRNLVEGSFDGIFLRQRDHIVFANARLSHMLGYSEAELKSLDRWQIYHPDDRKIAQERTSARTMGDHVAPRYDVRLLRKDGSSFPAELDARVFRVEGEPLIQVCVRDISERKQAEEERLQLVTAIEHAAEIIAITDTDGSITYINPAVETISGYTREEIVGHTLYALGKGAHDAASYENMVSTLGSGKVWSGRIINRKKNGTTFETEISISPVRGDDNEVIGYVAVGLSRFAAARGLGLRK